jgi:hypothetical protein
MSQTSIIVPIPLTTHMIHPRVSLSISLTRSSMAGGYGGRRHRQPGFKTTAADELGDGCSIAVGGSGRKRRV